MPRLSAGTRKVALLAAGASVALAAAPSAAIAADGWAWPVRGEVITAYSNDNSRPYAGGMHRGIDIAAPVGARVTAARGGRVTFAGALGSAGLTVAIATADGLHATSYLHLSRITVARGDWVGAGQEVGESGTSGKRSAGEPHLHFGVRRAGRPRSYVDPLILLPSLPGERNPAPVPPPAPAPAPVRQLKPVPAGLPSPAARRLPIRHRALSPGTVLTPEPAPSSEFGWGQPVALAGLLLLATVLGRCLIRGASTRHRGSGAVRGQDSPQPSPRPAAVVSRVGSAAQVG